MPGDNIPESMGEDFSESVGEDISEQAGAIISESVGGFPRNQHISAFYGTPYVKPGSERHFISTPGLCYRSICTVCGLSPMETLIFPADGKL
jgi:hypothetical protein